MPGKGAGKKAREDMGFLQMKEKSDKEKGITEDFQIIQWGKIREQAAEVAPVVEKEKMAAPEEVPVDLKKKKVEAVVEVEKEQMVEDDYDRLCLFVGGDYEFGGGAKKKKGGGGGGDFDEKDRLIIRVDNDLAIPYLSTSILEKPKSGWRSELNDEQRRTEWMLKRELKALGVQQYEIPMDEITHVRSHAQVNSMADKFQHLAKEADGPLLIGLDDEGGDKNVSPAMLQLAAKVGKEKADVVVQLRSYTREATPAHVFVEGHPERLKEVFEIENAVFVGRCICEDTRSAAIRAGLSAADANELKIVEVSRVYAFCEALVNGGDALLDFVKNGTTGLFTETSLKTFCQFVEPRLIMSKITGHRVPSIAGFDESKGLVKDEIMEYAASDARWSMENLLKLLAILKISADRLATTVGFPNLFADAFFEDILRKFAEIEFKSEAEIQVLVKDLSREESKILFNLRDAVPELRRKLAASHKSTLEERAIKQVLKRQLKEERDVQKKREKGDKIGSWEPTYVVKINDFPSAKRIMPEGSGVDSATRGGCGATRGNRSETAPEPEVAVAAPAVRKSAPAAPVAPAEESRVVVVEEAAPMEETEETAPEMTVAPMETSEPEVAVEPAGERQVVTKELVESSSGEEDDRSWDNKRRKNVPIAVPVNNNNNNNNNNNSSYNNNNNNNNNNNSKPIHDRPICGRARLRLRWRCCWREGAAPWPMTPTTTRRPPRSCRDPSSTASAISDPCPAGPRLTKRPTLPTNSEVCDMLRRSESLQRVVVNRRRGSRLRVDSTYSYNSRDCILFLCPGETQMNPLLDDLGSQNSSETGLPNRLNSSEFVFAS